MRETAAVRPTPLLLVLVVVEAHRRDLRRRLHPGDLRGHADPFIVFTSNIFAILGLRALYFLLAGLMEKFTYLKFGLAAVLVVRRGKMLLVDFYKVPTLSPRRDHRHPVGRFRGLGSGA